MHKTSFKIERLYNRIDSLSKRISWGEADKVGIMVFKPYDDSKNRFDKRFFETEMIVEFENMKVPIPMGYDSILKILYGDYHNFPPLEERGNWHHFEFAPDIPYYDYLDYTRLDNNGHIDDSI